ncbi:hypothetical protein QUF72_00235 [Desulfobacterales bacterium HSG2]|nr:hypothetical protein [Desulfobacterales bacterium HSG2]
MMKTQTKVCIMAAVFLICGSFLTGSSAFAIQVSGTVILEDSGDPMVGADISAKNERSTEVTDTTVDNGGFTLVIESEGIWEIKVSPPSDNETYSGYNQGELVKLDIKDLNKNITLPESIKMRRVKEIRGFVIIPEDSGPPDGGDPPNPDEGDPPDQPLGEYVADVLVTAYTDDHGTRIEKRTNENGEYILPDVFEGNWTIYADATFTENYKEYGQSERVKVTVGMGEVTPAQPLELHKCHKRIFGSVTFNGESLPDIEVHANDWHIEDGTRVVHTDSNGAFEIWVPLGRWEIRVPQVENVQWFSPEPMEAEFEPTPESEEERQISIALQPVGTEESYGGYLKGQVVKGSDSTLLTSDGDINEYVRIKAVSPESGFSRSVNLKSDGTFIFPLPVGLYKVTIWLDKNQYGDYGIPPPMLVRMDSGETEEDMGDIVLKERNLSVQGQVTDGTDVEENGISGIRVEAWGPDQRDRFFAETDVFGNYTINLPAGKWHIRPIIPGRRTDLFREVNLAEGVEGEDIDFVVTDADNVISGTVKDQSRNILTDVKARAYARLKGSPRPVSEAWVENGTFTLNVPAGTFYVGLRLAPDSEYAFAEENERVPTQDTEIFTLTSDRVVISGQFLDSADDSPVTGIEGRVFVTPVNERASWHGVDINTEDGSYNLSVPAGTWNMGYDLKTDQYLPHPEQPIQVEVASEGTTKKDITLTELSSTVKGQVVGPDGNSMSDVQVWVRQFRTGETGQSIFTSSVFTDADGKFEITVPASSATRTSKGTSKDYNEYYACLYTAIDECGEDDYYCLVDAEVECQQELYKRYSPRADEDVILTLRKADTYVEGTVLKSDGQTVEGAFVSAHSKDGQSTSGYTKSDGTYQLDAAKAETFWVARAWYKEVGDDAYYRSDFVTTTSSSADETITMLDLTLPAEASGKLPTSETDDFLLEDGWIATLSDGTEIQIPADGIRTEETDLTVVIAPQIELPESSKNRIIGYGYTMTLYEKDTGVEILDDFVEEAKICIYYDELEDQLTLLEVTVADIRAAYFMTESNSWQTLGSYTLDEENKKICFETDHFSDWALIAVISEEPSPGDINNSTAVDLADAILALQVCTESPITSTIYAAADVNDDKKIGLAEVIYILQKLVVNTGTHR